MIIIESSNFPINFMKLLDEADLLYNNCCGVELGHGSISVPVSSLMRPLNSCPHHTHESMHLPCAFR